jgi:hypothetical protein
MHATFDIVVHAHEFLNIDLSSRGAYAVRIAAGYYGPTSLSDDAGSETQQQNNHHHRRQHSRGVEGVPYVFTAAPATKDTCVRGRILKRPSWADLDSEIDGNYYRTRSFCIRYRDESAVLNEVVQFQLPVPLSKGFLVGKESRRNVTVTLNFELLHAKMPKSGSNGCGSDQECDSEERPNFEVVSTAQYTVQLGWPAMQAYVPVTFKGPQFILLDTMVHCVLLNIRAQSPWALNDLTLSPRKVGQDSEGSTVEGKTHSEGDVSQSRHPLETFFNAATSPVAGSKSEPHAAYASCLAPITRSLDSILRAVAWVKNLTPVKKGILEIDREESSGTVDSLDEENRSLRHLMATLGHESHPNILRAYDLSPPFPPPLIPKTMRSALEAAQTHLHLLARLCLMEWSRLIILLPQCPAALCEELKGEWIAHTRQKWALQSFVHTRQVSRPRETAAEPPPELAVLEDELDSDAFTKGLRRRLRHTRGLANSCMRVTQMSPGREMPICLCQRYFESMEGASSEQPIRSLLDDLEQRSNLGSFFRADLAKERVGSFHLVVLVHGFQGCAQDMRLMKNYMQVLLPDVVCLCSSSNQDKPHASLADMGNNLAREVKEYTMSKFPQLLAGTGRLSFIGHSAGALVIRSALATEHLQPLTPRLDIFLSLSSPHVGTLFGVSPVVSTATWAMRKWSTSVFLDQLTLADAADPYVRGLPTCS